MSRITNKDRVTKAVISMFTCRKTHGKPELAPPRIMAHTLDEAHAHGYCSAVQDCLLSLKQAGLVEEFFIGEGYAVIDGKKSEPVPQRD